MGRTLKVYKDGTYRIWSSIPEDWVSERMHRKDMIRQLDAENKLSAKLATIESWMSFPSGWCEKDSHKMLNFGGASEFLQWKLDALKTKDFETMVEAKYKEAMKDLMADGI